MLTDKLTKKEKEKYFKFKCGCLAPIRKLEARGGGGIGQRIFVMCTTCKNEKEITDYDVW
jgi:hypothetical protein